MAFMLASSFRMQATMITLAGLPTALNHSAKLLIVGLQRMAERQQLCIGHFIHQLTIGTDYGFAQLKQLVMVLPRFLYLIG